LTLCLCSRVIEEASMSTGRGQAERRRGIAERTVAAEPERSQPSVCAARGVALRRGRVGGQRVGAVGTGHAKERRSFRLGGVVHP
jgi:hypothetical protein